MPLQKLKALGGYKLKSMKNINTIKKNKKPCPAKPWRSGGFVLLYVIVISSIVLAISIGVTNIAYNEVKFSTSGKDTNDAFFAADTGVECALFWDSSDINSNAFLYTGDMKCDGHGIALSGNTGSGPWQFEIDNLGSSSNSCVKVNVDKGDIPYTTITSVGESVCDSPNSVKRQLEVTY